MLCIPAFRLATDYHMTNLCSVYQPLDWQLTTQLGCGHEICDALPQAHGMHITGAIFYVCQFIPTYFRGRDGDRGPCTDEPCPSGAPFCVSFVSEYLGVFEDRRLSYCGKYYNTE